MNYLNSNVAREAGRLHRWREKFWGRRYRAVPVRFEPEAQIARLSYLLAQGWKASSPGPRIGPTPTGAPASFTASIGFQCGSRATAFRRQ